MCLRELLSGVSESVFVNMGVCECGCVFICVCMSDHIVPVQEDVCECVCPCLRCVCLCEPFSGLSVCVCL